MKEFIKNVNSADSAHTFIGRMLIDEILLQIGQKQRNKWNLSFWNNNLGDLIKLL